MIKEKEIELSLDMNFQEENHHIFHLKTCCNRDKRRSDYNIFKITSTLAKIKAVEQNYAKFDDDINQKWKRSYTKSIIKYKKFDTNISSHKTVTEQHHSKHYSL